MAKCIQLSRLKCFYILHFFLSTSYIFLLYLNSFFLQWQFPWILWVIYRILTTVTHIGFSLFVFVHYDHVYTFKYLSNWLLYLITVYFLMATVNLFKDRMHGRNYHYGSNNDDLRLIGNVVFDHRYLNTGIKYYNKIE